MRATLAIADDVVAAAEKIARREGKSVGEVVSELARRALPLEPEPMETRNGVPLLPVIDPEVVITLELVNALRDDEP